nr:hypothetical protein [Tanacetum cinerariifolium]
MCVGLHVSHEDVNASICLSQVKGRLVEQKERELKYCEKIRVLEFHNESRANCIEILKKELELIKKENEGVDGKLEGFLTASKDLDNLIESKRSDKNKEGLGYSVVPPPLAQIYSSPKKDLSWIGLSEFTDDTITDYSRPSPAIEKYFATACDKEFPLLMYLSCPTEEFALLDEDKDYSQLKTHLSQLKTCVSYSWNIRGLELDVEFKNIEIQYLMNELKQVKKEKEGLDSKQISFESASKDLDTLLGSQRTDKNKEGLGYSAVPPSCSSILSSQERYVLDRIA